MNFLTLFSCKSPRFPGMHDRREGMPGKAPPKPKAFVESRLFRLVPL